VRRSTEGTAGRLAGRYSAVAALVVCSLVPYLVLSAALQPLAPIIARDLGMTGQEMSLANGVANAGYALGTVASVQLALLLPQRRLLLVYGALLVIGSVLAAAATAPAVFIAGHVMQGLCTSMLLIAAVPPLVIGYPESKLRPTALILNVGIFGAVALGPFIGGLQADAGSWRPLFWVTAAIAIVALVLSVLTFQDAPPAAADSPDEPRAGAAAESADGPPKDPLAVGLAAAGCLLGFYGASELLTHEFVSARTLLSLAVGASLIAVLVVYQFTARRPLLAVRGVLRSTFPVAGIVAAICAAAGSVGAIGLTAATLADRYAPLHVGLLYLPEFAGALIAAFIFARVFQTRYIHWMALSGLVLLAAGTVVMIAQIPPSPAATLVGSGLVGVGLGASVVPALFIAGLSLRNAGLQRVFAIVELFRAVAAFMIAPILVHIATTVAGGGAAGTRTALWICFGLVVGGALTGVALYALGGLRPRPRTRTAGSQARRAHGIPRRCSPACAAARALGSSPPRSFATRASEPSLGSTAKEPRRATDPAPLCSPTTAQSSPRPPSRRPASNCAPGARRSSSPCGARRRSSSCPIQMRRPTPSTPFRCERRPGEWRHTERRSPTQPGSAPTR
jgi:MFS family permease